jgi:hypothetical protein
MKQAASPNNVTLLYEASRGPDTNSNREPPKYELDTVLLEATYSVTSAVTADF